MRQFDVVGNPAESSRIAPYLVVLQSHYLAAMDTTVVAPLIWRGLLPPDAAFALAVEFQGRPLTLAVQQLSSVSVRRLGQVVGDLAAYDLEIARAWERLFTGF